MKHFEGKLMVTWKGKSYGGDQLKRMLDAARERRRDLRKGCSLHHGFHCLVMCFLGREREVGHQFQRVHEVPF